MVATTRVLVLGAAGRDLHDFATVLRDDPAIAVVGFTAVTIVVAFGGNALWPHSQGSRVADALAGRCGTWITP